MKRTLLLIASIGAAAALAAGCAATGTIDRARACFDKSKTAGAEKASPYEYYQTEEYLKMADHEASEGHSKQAAFYADEAAKYCAAALEKAGGGAK